MDLETNGAMTDETAAAASDTADEAAAQSAEAAAAEASEAQQLGDTQDASDEAADAGTAESTGEAGEAETFECSEETDDAAPSAEGADAAEDTDPQPSKKKSPVLGICLAVLVALLAVAAIFIAKSVKGSTAIAHENELGYMSYTMTADQVSDRVLDRTVAECGSEKLTNRQLPFYYWQEYYSFLNTYSQYAAYLIDSSKGLDEQEYTDGITWQQQFLDAAVQMFYNVSSICQEAAANGYTLSSDEQDYLASLAENLDSAAAYYGFESGETYLHQAFGDDVTIADYQEFVEKNLIASGYLSQLVEQADPTDEEVEAYYDENAESFEAKHITKVDRPMVTVRHILIQPTETDDDGSYTEAAWAAAEEEINKIYDEWEAGEQTEDAFAALAQEYSVDGSASNGGLISDVYPGATVENFNDWCFDESRKVGDVGIVKTEYGYHIIYLSSISDTIYWRESAKSEYLSTLSTTISDDILAKYETKTTLENAALTDVLAAQRAAQEQAAAESEADSGSSDDASTDASSDTGDDASTDASGDTGEDQAD